MGIHELCNIRIMLKFLVINDLLSNSLAIVVHCSATVINCSLIICCKTAFQWVSRTLWQHAIRCHTVVANVVSCSQTIHRGKIRHRQSGSLGSSTTSTLHWKACSSVALCRVKIACPVSVNTCDICSHMGSFETIRDVNKHVQYEAVLTHSNHLL